MCPNVKKAVFCRCQFSSATFSGAAKYAPLAVLLLPPPNMAETAPRHTYHPGKIRVWVGLRKKNHAFSPHAAFVTSSSSHAYGTETVCYRTQVPPTPFFAAPSVSSVPMPLI